MPLGRQRVVSPQSPTGDPRTAIFHSNSTTSAPLYKSPPSPTKPRIHSSRDLSYFHALASGEVQATELPANGATLALNLFRGTERHRFPIAERLGLGPAVGAPYYAARATPSTISTHEYNTIIVSRRHPLRFVNDEVCVANIRPKLNIFAPGIHEIGVISRNVHGLKSVHDEDYFLSWSSGMGSSLDSCWSLWYEGKAVAQFYAEGGFRSLDDDSRKGVIRVKPPRDSNIDGIGPPDFQNPRTIDADLAYLDFETEEPLFVSSDYHAHRLMDIIVSSLFMLLTVATRKAAGIRDEEEALWQHEDMPPHTLHEESMTER